MQAARFIVFLLLLHPSICLIVPGLLRAALPVGLYELKLRDELFSNRRSVESHSRPLNSHNERITVHLSMAIRNIIKLDEKKQVFVLNSLMTLEWNDNRLKWNPINYGGVEGIHVPGNLLWKPDIVPYNSANASDLDIFTNDLLMVKSNGHITWLTPAITHTTCNINLKKFPFDRHVCSVIFGSWTYHGWSVQLIIKNDQILTVNQSENKDVDMLGLDLYQEHNIWQVVTTNATIVQKMYACCKEPYPTAFFNITLKRTSSAYVSSALIPTIVPVFVILAVFLIPPNSKHRLPLTAILFLYQLILSVQFYWKLPHNGSQPPSIIVFCCTCTILSAICLMETVIMAAVCRHKNHVTKSMNNCIRGWAGKILCLPLSIIQLSAKDGVTPAVDSNRSVIEMRNEHDWHTLTVAIDRIFFFVFCIVFAISIGVLVA